ncbi:MAG: threonine--tRNA ligase [Aminobacterium sp.]|jgi:threonyl-tRNA synthetase|uniref:threonine--tRNA ligase n=1 Tax=unclassified Aminobacterium TaxID=2685012 RepID=UPI001BCBBBEC|nr:MULTISPECIES: threonine--tRNA ligase [unclassified Aminobacterium]MDD2206517.1 threonine--tRNA ligase [Aminobacterium sp.]MDD3425929.1 threonine--tRNA ligase [Aminobacterium sp.]MDD3707008.1 threonine--tRNA ligase [Aminobacterium sp.]MDD4228435.1 threonine--tRNA ligase [Aminobacterium sp.]MDD4551358.1 threonine--tRNA ligase [Aminobacterium sp.]
MFELKSTSGSVVEVEDGKVLDILKRWDMNKGAVAAKINGRLVDLSADIAESGLLESVDGASEEGLEIIRHSTAHLMAQAFQSIFPETHFGIGPAIKNGFYYDMELPEPISEDVLPKIEKEMKRLTKRAFPIEREVLSKEDAIRFFEERGEKYKVELIKEIEDSTVSLYKQGDYVDLCRGPHVPNTSWIKYFKLLSVAGAYWRGSEKNIMLTRVYGTAFADEESLKQYITMLEEAKNRDHRKIGKELDLFSLQPEGPGFPFFHPKGMVILNKLTEFWRQVHEKNGYCEIRTPLILDRSLWIRSGHWDHYRDNMYFTEIDEMPFAIKPMNCPGGILVYKSQIRSYRDLPLRMAELGTVHRHERSGVLHGLMRVRCFTQDDAHLYCTPEQVKDEIKGIMRLCQYIYRDVFGFKYTMELSTRPEDSMGSEEQWNIAERALKEALEETNMEYRVNPGDGAFYGPKIDFHLEDCIGRTWQCGTIQLDFQMPEKFDLSYVGADGKEHRPVMLHRTILGSLERFFGILIEQFAGAFPYWLAPIQVRLLPISEDFFEYANEVKTELATHGVRVEIDCRDEKLGKKIRDAQIQKIPYMVVLGEKEASSKQVAPRDRSKGDLGAMSINDFVKVLEEEFNPLICK